MRSSFKLPCTFIGLCGMVVVSAVISTGVATAAPKKAMKNASELVVVNDRQSELSALVVADQAGKQVGALSAPLAPGKKARIRLAKGAGCVLNVSVAFADEGETEGTTDACRDKELHLKD